MELTEFERKNLEIKERIANDKRLEKLEKQRKKAKKK